MPRMFETNDKGSVGSIVDVSLVGDKEVGNYGYRPSISMSYTRGGFVPNFDNRWTDDGDTVVDDTWGYRDRSRGWDDTPDTLFDAVSPEVHTLFSDFRMRAHVPTMLGHVLKNAQSAGVPITAAYDLSEHSSRLSKKGIKAGLVVGHEYNKEANQSNTVGSEGADNYTEVARLENIIDPTTGKPYLGREVPSEELADFRRIGREAVRGMKRKRKTGPATHPVRDSPQFEQLKLDI